ncbi:hypothetical protein ACKKBG_A18125 [Auxenochlorella protothecoides x Auxenochlorella symbiontica]
MSVLWRCLTLVFPEVPNECYRDTAAIILGRASQSLRVSASDKLWVGCVLKASASFHLMASQMPGSAAASAELLAGASPLSKALAVQCSNLELALRQEDVTHCSSGIALAQCLVRHSAGAAAATIPKRAELAARGPTAMAMSALRALQAARSVDANAALTSALLCAGPTLSAFLSSGLDGGEGSLQPMCVLELVCTASATQDPSLRQAPHPMARTLLGISMAVVDAAQDGPAAVAQTAGAVEGPAKPVALSELGAWGADLSLVLKILGRCLECAGIAHSGVTAAAHLD